MVDTSRNGQIMNYAMDREELRFILKIPVIYSMSAGCIWPYFCWPEHLSEKAKEEECCIHIKKMMPFSWGLGQNKEQEENWPGAWVS